MNNEKVRTLAKIVREKREKFNNIGMIDVNQPDLEKREAIAVAYEIAKAEMFKAEANFLNALQL